MSINNSSKNVRTTAWLTHQSFKLNSSSSTEWRSGVRWFQSFCKFSQICLTHKKRWPRLLPKLSKLKSHARQPLKSSLHSKTLAASGLLPMNARRCLNGSLMVALYSSSLVQTDWLRWSNLRPSQHCLKPFWRHWWLCTSCVKTLRTELKSGA